MLHIYQKQVSISSILLVSPGENVVQLSIMLTISARVYNLQHKVNVGMLACLRKISSKHF